MADYDLMRIRRVGDRLRASFRAAVEAFPPNARNISGMARWLGVHKATCQRVVEGLDAGRDGLTTFARLPGVEGLQMVIDAARSSGVDGDLLASAEAAIGEYESLLHSYGRTQRGLVRIIESLRIEAAGPEGQPDRDMQEDQRKALFDGARRVTGEEMKGKAIVAIVRPRPDQPSRLDAFLYSRLLGARRHSFSRPIVTFILGGWWSHLHGPGGAPATRPVGVSADTIPFHLVEEFSTAGVRPVRIGAADARTLVVVDLDSVPSDGDGQGPADVTGRFHSAVAPNPVWDSRARLDCTVRVTCPARSMLMDIYLHHSLASQLVPHLACYSLAAPPGDSPDGGPDQCWYERFPDMPEVVSLGRAQPPRPHPAFPRHDELVSHAFAKEGVDPADYHGFRAEVAYPIWQSEYRMYFERPRQEDDQ
ncbi:MAG: hypothetical protein IT438_10750 [Phycisphaerales bacterium]|nr:hypothetical protein [Phycisphaerales bacterium]